MEYLNKSILTALLFIFTYTQEALAQHFKAEHPKEGKILVYLVRQPNPYGAVVAWPTAYVGRSVYQEENKFNKIRKQMTRLNKLKQKRYQKLELNADEEYFITSGDHSINLKAPTGSVLIFRLNGITSELQCD